MEESDLQKYLRAVVEQGKQKEYAVKPIRTLGEVLLLLRMQPENNIVTLDFTGENPGGLHSYRGYYEDLSLDYGDAEEPKTVKILREMFEASNGKTYFGYHGGDFVMNMKTLVWVAKHGRTGRMLTDIKSSGNFTVILTQEDES